MPLCRVGHCEVDYQLLRPRWCTKNIPGMSPGMYPIGLVHQRGSSARLQATRCHQSSGGCWVMMSLNRHSYAFGDRQLLEPFLCLQWVPYIFCHTNLLDDKKALGYQLVPYLGEQLRDNLYFKIIMWDLF